MYGKIKNGGSVESQLSEVGTGDPFPTYPEHSTLGKYVLQIEYF